MLFRSACVILTGTGTQLEVEVELVVTESVVCVVDTPSVKPTCFFPESSLRKLEEFGVSGGAILSELCLDVGVGEGTQSLPTSYYYYYDGISNTHNDGIGQDKSVQ